LVSIGSIGAFLAAIGLVVAGIIVAIVVPLTLTSNSSTTSEFNLFF
jgi:hypothetical protein